MWTSCVLCNTPLTIVMMVEGKWDDDEDADEDDVILNKNYLSTQTQPHAGNVLKHAN